VRVFDRQEANRLKEVGCVRLAYEIIQRAVSELGDPDPKVQRKAERFLFHKKFERDLQFWLDIAGVNSVGSFRRTLEKFRMRKAA
jgi:hypothetical protein